MEIAEELRKFTTLLYFEFFMEELEVGNYKLVITLAENELSSAKQIRIEFSRVTSLCIKDFGGGITQLLCLSIEDIKDKQLDLVNYLVSELERDSISFMCHSFTITEIT